MPEGDESMGIGLYDYQLEAIDRMKNGCILCGGVGSGKSRTALGYFFKENGGELTGDYKLMRPDPKDLYIITTARKRDSKEWELDMAPFLISPDRKGLYSHQVIIDSWNNISKYTTVSGAFFIFDEQRVVGKGKWVKSFLKIAKQNDWILLSATPGDQWSDYIPVFIANGFYKNRTQFYDEHVVWSHFTQFPKIDRYLNTKRLTRLRDSILVDMDFHRPTEAHHEDVLCNYDILEYKMTMKNRWNPYTDEPIENASELCYTLRKIVNSSEDRQKRLLELYEDHPKSIIFYNFDYELEILLSIFTAIDIPVAQWNGHKHQPIPDTDKWVYLVQYTAGSEAWNCVLTDTIIFYSQTYSYKTLEQSCGRIDRLNTPFHDLYYYHLKSHAAIDLAIGRALRNKKNFNEGRFYYKLFDQGEKHESNTDSKPNS